MPFDRRAMARPFGVRRQSAAATRIGLVQNHQGVVALRPPQHGCRAGDPGACHRTPNTGLLQYRLKLYSNSIYIDTGWPFFLAGTNLICRAAAIAFSVSPPPRGCMARMLVTSPVRENTTRKTTVPVIPLRLASSVYWGSGLESTRARSLTCGGE